MTAPRVSSRGWTRLAAASWRRCLSAGAHAGMAGAGYRATVRIVGVLCRSRRVRQALSPPGDAVVAGFATLLGDGRDASRLARHSAVNHVLAALTRSAAFGRIPFSQLRGLVSVEEQHYLDAARARGRGVVVAGTASLGGGAIRRWLAREARDLERLGPPIAWDEASGPPDAGPHLTLARARRYLAARRHLEAGSLVGVAANATPRVTRNTVECTVLGRRLCLLATFAQLAVDTGAAAVPVAALLLPDGRVRVVVFPPLGGDGAGAPREARVVRLVREYAGLYERLLREYPESFQLRQLHRVLRAPSAGMSVSPAPMARDRLEVAG